MNCAMTVIRNSVVVTSLVFFLVSVSKVISAVNDDPLFDSNSEEHKRFLDQLVKSKTTGLSLEEADEFRKNLKKMTWEYGVDAMSELMGERPSPSTSNVEPEAKKKKSGDYKGPVDELDNEIGDLLIRLAVVDMKLRQLEEGIADHLEDAVKISSSLSAVKMVLDQQVTLSQKVYELLGKLISQSKKSMSSIQQLVANYKRDLKEGDAVRNFLQNTRKGYNDQSMKLVIYTERLQTADKARIEERLNNLDKALSRAEKKEKNLLEILETFLSEHRNLIKLGKQVTLSSTEDDFDQIQEDNEQETDYDSDEDEDYLPSVEWKAKLHATLEKYQVGLSLLNNSTSPSKKNVKDEL